MIKPDRLRNYARTCRSRHKRNKSSSSLSSSISIHTPLPSQNQESNRLNLSKLNLEHKAPKANLIEVIFLVLEKVKKYFGSVDYRIYRLFSRSLHYVDIVPSCVAKLVKHAKSQMKARFCDPKKPVSIIEFLKTFNLAGDTNNTLDGVDMWILTHHVKKKLAATLNGHLCAQYWLAPLAASVRHKHHCSRKLLRSFPEVVNYLLK